MCNIFLFALGAILQACSEVYEWATTAIIHSTTHANSHCSNCSLKSSSRRLLHSWRQLIASIWPSGASRDASAGYGRHPGRAVEVRRHGTGRSAPTVRDIARRHKASIKLCTLPSDRPRRGTPRCRLTEWPSASAGRHRCRPSGNISIKCHGAKWYYSQNLTRSQRYPAIPHEVMASTDWKCRTNIH